MPDATEWLVESRDQDGEPAYAHFETLDVVQAHVRKLFDDGFREVYVYQRVPFEVKVDVTVKAPRKRKRKEAKVGAASPDAQGGHTSQSPQGESGGLPTAGPVPASPVLLIHSGKEEESPVEGADRRPAPSRVSVWICEASFPGDAECPGPVEYDPITKGRFCSLHAEAITESGRQELHRRHGARNAPAAEAVG